MKKEELIKTAKKLLANSDFSKEEVEKVKGLRNEYKAIGFAGKEKAAVKMTFVRSAEKN